jgi:hypothetical protein
MQEKQAARTWLERCKQSGTGVLWLANDDGREARRITDGTGAKLLVNMVNPVTVASEIGLTAARALTGASA